MAYNAVGRLHITNLWSTVVTFSAVTVTYTSVKIRSRVTLFTGGGVMGKYLGCGGGRGASTTFNVTGKAFSRIKGIMILY